MKTKQTFAEAFSEKETHCWICDKKFNQWEPVCDDCQKKRSAVGNLLQKLYRGKSRMLCKEVGINESYFWKFMNGCRPFRWTNARCPGNPSGPWKEFLKKIDEWLKFLSISVECGRNIDIYGDISKYGVKITDWKNGGLRVLECPDYCYPISQYKLLCDRVTDAKKKWDSAKHKEEIWESMGISYHTFWVLSGDGRISQKTEEKVIEWLFIHSPSPTLEECETKHEETK
jgi:hypothetical protein